MASFHRVGLILALAALPAAAGTPSAFTEEALARGLSFTMTIQPQTLGYVGQGSAFIDLDNDGDPDVVLIGRPTGQIGIFENIGGGNFVDHSATCGVPLLSQQEAVTAADYDGDGDLDLYLTQAINQTNYLMRNDGSFTFTDVTFASGVNNGLQNSTGTAWADYNGDGWLDLYISNYGQGNGLYRNNGGANFTNVGGLLGVHEPSGFSFQNQWTDYDRDGDVDLYLSQDRAPLGFPRNRLWRNDGGTFVNVSGPSGANVEIYSMGIAAGDLDNNGYPDLYLTNVNSVDSTGGTVEYDGYNPLLMNQGNGTFTESAESWEVDNRLTSWAAIFFDWDNDMYKDLYVNNQFEPNSFFDCNGALPCTEIANSVAIEAAFDAVYDLSEDPPTIASFNASVADVDGDGDLDILVNNPGYRAELFINHEGSKNDYVRMNVVGEHPNLFAIGGNVEVTTNGTTQFYEIYAGGNGYLGQNELTVHVGLGTADYAEQTVVSWPGGSPTRTLTGLPANNVWTIYPPSRLCDSDDDGVDYDDLVDFAACFDAGFSAGCEMMDFDGDSIFGGDDIDDCFVTAAADCNGNGTEDVAEIVMDLSLDADQNYVIDCCAGTPDDPNEVGNTLLVSKNGSDQPILSWTTPPVDGTHAAATTFDVFRASAAQAEFPFMVNVAATTHTDTGTTPDRAFYLVGARNACGSSGEEPF